MLQINILPELRIDVPEGFEIDKENSTFEVIKFKKIQKQLPKSWNDLKIQKGYYITVDSIIKSTDFPSSNWFNQNLLPSEELAEALLVFCQLSMLRDEYRDGWKPSFHGTNTLSHSIRLIEGKWSTVYGNHNYFFSFPTSEIRDEFFKNFIDLLNKVKPIYS